MSPGPETWLRTDGPRVIHIRDRAGDVLDHTGHHVRGHAGVDLVDVTLIADVSGLTVVFTCHGNIPASSGPGGFGPDEKHDELLWEAAFWFTGNIDDARRYFQLRASLIGTAWQGGIFISVGSTQGFFKLTSVPIRKRDEIIFFVPWSKPVTSTKVNGAVVTLPRLPKRVFVSAGTSWDFFSPPGDLSDTNGGDKAPDADKRAEFSF